MTLALELLVSNICSRDDLLKVEFVSYLDYLDCETFLFFFYAGLTFFSSCLSTRSKSVGRSKQNKYFFI